MSITGGLHIGLAGLAVLGLSACAAEKAEPAASTSASSTATTATTTAPASATIITTVTTVTATSSTTQDSTTATTGTTSSTSTPMVGGMTECTKAALAQPATQAAQALGPNNVYAVDQLNCADGWAVTSGLLTSKENPQMGAPTSFVFEQEGQFWVPKDKSKVCGTNPITTTPPADAEIPAALFVAGCAAG